MEKNMKNQDDIDNLYRIEVVEIKDNDDGSCTVMLDITNASLVIFAKKGILEVLKSCARKIIDEET